LHRLSFWEGFFMIGKTLGHYEITSQPGKGGMGEVYQASQMAESFVSDI
jgi:hypothetical protein